MLNNNLGGEIVDHLSFPLCTVWYEKTVYRLRMKTTKCPRWAEGLHQVSCQAVLSTTQQIRCPLLNRTPQSRISDGQGAGPQGPNPRREKPPRAALPGRGCEPGCCLGLGRLLGTRSRRDVMGTKGLQGLPERGLQGKEKEIPWRRRNLPKPTLD